MRRAIVTKNFLDNPVTAANVKVHSILANAGEYQKSPHFRPENIKKVDKIITNIIEQNAIPRGARAIDFGCGTGFIIDLIHKHFSEVHGVDITEDMMKFVDTSPGNIFLHKSMAETTSFEDNSFEFASAYSFMDHLQDYKKFLAEAYRVLKPEGIFYSDLNPNKEFIKAMDKAENSCIPSNSDFIDREIKGALHNGQYYNDQYGIDPNLLDQAEPIKSSNKGFVDQEVYKTALEIGFKECTVEYEWFLGQGNVMHNISHESANLIDAHLKSIKPISSPLYKYLRFIFKK